MKINVGSKNEAKLNAVKETANLYDFLSNSEINCVDVNIEVFGQPKSLNETVEGAMNRAKNSFVNCDLSIGIEAGLIQVPHTKSGFMDIQAACIYDGKNFHFGLSSAFEFPKKVMDLVLNSNLDASQAFHKLGLTDKIKIGNSEGGIGLLTKGKIIRKDLIKQALMNALIHLENPGLF